MCLVLLLIPALLFAAEPPKHSIKPSQGYVPDEATAVKIAEAVLIPVFGKEKIAEEQPFLAKLKNDIWYVEGSLKPGWKGGVAEIEISKDNGRVLRVSRGR